METNDVVREIERAVRDAMRPVSWETEERKAADGPPEEYCGWEPCGYANFGGVAWILWRRPR